MVMNDKLFLNIWKEKGETPLQVLERLRLSHPEYSKAKLSYAGRLDPMASGIMTVVIGDENKNKEKYLNLDKVYKTEILFGVSTDTHDVLGVLKDLNPKEVDKVDLEEKIKSFQGFFVQKYPNYSSKTIDGVQMHQLSREGKEYLSPKHQVSLYSSKIVSSRTINVEEIFDYVKKSVSLVSGDFRQDLIINSWEKIKKENNNFCLFELELSVSSGFYVRQFASDLGELIGIPAIAYSIERIRVGEWERKNCLYL